ncbi:chymotrypsin-like protease CTRL-1 [Convolutriloba macropyga]|uniref:chymotrypsin-like protease CTRL-1 n=1 Tax=Convolutriloba macropyga TaxID=536237 RepID=UPI003F522434
MSGELFSNDLRAVGLCSTQLGLRGASIGGGEWGELKWGQGEGEPNLPIISAIIHGHKSPFRPFYANILTVDDHGDHKKCGGTIVRAEWIVTAAKCVHGIRLSRMFVMVGDYTHPDDLKRDLVTVARVIVHEKAYPSSYRHDIALLRLVLPLKPELASFALPLCRVPVAINSCSYLGTCGMGAVSPVYDLEPANLREIYLTEAKGGFLLNRCPKSVICTKRTGNINHNICRGDEGGPLYQFYPSSHMPQCLYGVASYYGKSDKSRQKCNGGNYFTSVPDHYYWILNMIHSN